MKILIVSAFIFTFLAKADETKSQLRLPNYPLQASYDKLLKYSHELRLVTEEYGRIEPMISTVTNDQRLLEFGKVHARLKRAEELKTEALRDLLSLSSSDLTALHALMNGGRDAIDTAHRKVDADRNDYLHLVGNSGYNGNTHEVVDKKLAVYKGEHDILDSEAALIRSLAPSMVAYIDMAQARENAAARQLEATKPQPKIEHKWEIDPSFEEVPLGYDEVLARQRKAKK